ncbi:UNVERIFIED_CONTAM: hypothetical protein FKN15_064295 [Acipenser sinensis]
MMSTEQPQKRMVSSVFITLASPHRPPPRATPHSANTTDTQIRPNQIQSKPSSSSSSTEPRTSWTEAPLSPTRTENQPASSQTQPLRASLLNQAKPPPNQITPATNGITQAVPPSASRAAPPTSANRLYQPKSPQGTTNLLPGSDSLSSTDFFPPPPPVEELSSPARLEAVSPSFSNQGLQTLPGRPADSSGQRSVPMTGALRQDRAPPAGKRQAAQNELWETLAVQQPSKPEEPVQKSTDFFPPPPPVEELSSPARLEAVSPSFSNQGLQTLPGHPANSSGQRSVPMTGALRQDRAPPAGNRQAAQDELWKTLAVQQPSKPEEPVQKSTDICGFCHKAISPTVQAIEAMKEMYHASCFTCRKCCHPLAGELYYNKEGVPICDPCYKATLERCGRCDQVITDRVTRAMETVFHPECFTCAVCRRPIGDERFVVDDTNEVYCIPDYYRKYASTCSVCKDLIVPGKDGKDTFTVECLGRTFHEGCYRCEGTTDKWKLNTCMN